MDGLIVPELPRKVFPCFKPRSGGNRCGTAGGSPATGNACRIWPAPRFVTVLLPGFTGEREEINTDLASLTGTIRKMYRSPLVLVRVGMPTPQKSGPLCDGCVWQRPYAPDNRLISFDRAGERSGD